MLPTSRRFLVPLLNSRTISKDFAQIFCYLRSSTCCKCSTGTTRPTTTSTTTLTTITSNRLSCISSNKNNKSLFGNINHNSPSSLLSPLTVATSHCSNIHTTSRHHGLPEFFDDEKHWTASTVSVGRSWSKSELRTRSNQELHKIWYVLLKEMNMLLTMKAEYDRLYRSMPSPERLEKVEVSMDNLQDIVEERNRALSMLETGESPHPQWIDDTDELDRPIRRLEQEHLVPKEHNEEFMKKYDNLGDWTRDFKLLWNEKQREKMLHFFRKSKKLQRALLKRYPHLKEDPQFLEQYCNSKVIPADENPDVERLILKDQQRNE